MDKGLVARRRMGKAYYYKAMKSREGVMSRRGGWAMSNGVQIEFCE